MVLLMGSGVTFMALIPNPLWGRGMFVACALVILAVGVFLKRSAKPIA
jgi:SSS family solute:Na+ symporter